MTHRAIAPLIFPDVVPAELSGGRPVMRDVDPRSLIVDETYQRGLSDKSITLIRRIVAQWNWKSFKPPVVTDVDGNLHVIDGQHTAIAAATHGGLATIPVMIVDSCDVAERAKAFMGHNRDRIAVTALHLYYAAVAAGDDDAVTVSQVCERAGVTVLKFPPSNAVFKPGETMAINAIKRLVDRRGALRARQVLQVLVEARCAPVSMLLIRAADMLLHDPEYSGVTTHDDLTVLIRSRGAEAEQEAKVTALTHKLPLWRALTITLFRMRRSRGSRRAD